MSVGSVREADTLDLSTFHCHFAAAAAAVAVVNNAGEMEVLLTDARRVALNLARKPDIVVLMYGDVVALFAESQQMIKNGQSTSPRSNTALQAPFYFRMARFFEGGIVK